MDRYRMHNQDCRNNCMQQQPCPMPVPHSDCKAKTSEISCHGDELPLAMAYVPMQTLKTMLEPRKALCVGTIFPELCKPFVGKRGRMC